MAPGRRHQSVKVGQHYWRVSDGVLVRDDRDSLALADVTRSEYTIMRHHISLLVVTPDLQFRIRGLPRRSFQTICTRVLHGIAHYAREAEVRVIGGAWSNMFGTQVDPLVAAKAIMKDPNRAHKHLN